MIVVIDSYRGKQFLIEHIRVQQTFSVKEQAVNI